MAGRSNRKRKLPSLLLKLSFVLLFLGAGYVVKVLYLTTPTDFAGPGRNSVVVTIEPGDSVASIANNLKDAGVVASVDRFLYLAGLNSKSSTIQPGSYDLRLEMSSQLALDDLISGKNRTENGIVITEGSTVASIISKLSQRTGIPIANFQNEIKSPDKLGLPKWAEGITEGFLFPATYHFEKGTSARAILRQMVSEFLIQSNAVDLEATAKEMGRTPMEILITASLAQAESHPRDFSKVTRVVFNRLSAGMMLQFDSTVNYGLGKSPVLLDSGQLATDTDYNTYMRTGLTPTPINNPGLAAIQSALNPEPGPWIYFVTVNLQTQTTKFTESYTQFLEFKNELINYCARNKGEC